jgi:hypothetical protein
LHGRVGSRVFELIQIHAPREFEFVIFRAQETTFWSFLLNPCLLTLKFISCSDKHVKLLSGHAVDPESNAVDPDSKE